MLFHSITKAGIPPTKTERVAREKPSRTPRNHIMAPTMNVTATVGANEPMRLKPSLVTPTLQGT